MLNNSRRDFLKYTGIVATVTGTSIGAANAENDSDAGRRGIIEKIGQALPENPPRYTYGHVREDGRYGCVSSFPGEGNDYASTLYDLSELDNPEEIHRLETTNEQTRSNDVKFDGTRNGLYYRSQEADDFGEEEQEGEMGIEVIDYGYNEGSPTEPAVVAQLETPNTGVHKLTEHPEDELLYLVDKDDEEPGVLTVDVSDPANPNISCVSGPDGYCHDVEVDAVRNVLHAAYIGGDFVGYVIFDLSDPSRPSEMSRVDYADLPDYEEIGEPGFESCHQAHADPERDIVIVGDEIGGGIPGGKHIYDIGWDEGCLENPIHIGFTHSPNAKEQGDDEGFFWTTHFHDVIPQSKTDTGATLLVDGGYHEGAWVCDISDPTNPRPAESYPTRDREDESADHSPSHAPYCWSAIYNEERDFVFASDTLTGAYTFRVSDESFEFRSIEEELAPEGEIDADGVELATHYYLDHGSVPNTDETMAQADLEDLLSLFEEGGREGAATDDVDDDDPDHH